MAHKVLVGGTGYDVTKGRTLIGGTGYDVTKGRTYIGGTGYDISLGGSQFVPLMANATAFTRTGRNSSSTSSISVSITTAGTYYAFAFWNGDIGIHKIVSNGLGSITTTPLYQSNSPNCSLYKNNNMVYLSNTGTDATSVYGGTLALLTFTGFTENEIDSILSSVAKQDGTGRNASSTATVGLAMSAGSTVLTAYNAHMAVQSPVGTVIFSTYTTNPSLSRYDSGTLYISTNGTSNASVYGASIITL